MNKKDRKLQWLKRGAVSLMIIGTAWTGYATSQHSAPETAATPISIKDTTRNDLLLREQAEKFRESMGGMKGKELLQAHSNLCRLVSAGNDPNLEITCLHDFIAAARRQGDKEAEGLARTSLVYSWYNYNYSDSLLNGLSKQLSIMRANKTWDYYYNAWSALIDHYIYTGKLRTALNEAQRMYEEAWNDANNYGIGVAGYCVGAIYQAMGRYDEARKNLEECIETLKREDDISLLLSAYNILCETLDSLGSYAELRGVTTEWKEILDDYKWKAEKAGYAPILDGRYLYCTLASAIAEIGLKNTNAAAYQLALADQYVEGRKQVTLNKYLSTKARYYAAIGNYEEAIRYNLKNMELLEDQRDTLSLHTVKMEQAGYLLAIGDYQKSAELYKEIIPFHDQLRSQVLARQIDELSTLYEVDKLSMENHIARDIVTYITIACLLLLIVIGLYVYYNRRLKKKNKVLYETLLQLQKSEKENIKNTGKLESDKEGVIYRKLCAVMEEEKLYADPSIRREDLAERLGTNRTYLANAVKKYHGGTIGEFINDIRLKYAAEMLTSEIERNINEI